MNGREHADYIIREAIQQVMPDDAVKKALYGRDFSGGKVYLVAVGKAAWQMARVAAGQLGNVIEKGIVVTKYGHVKGEIPRVACYEAGHPVPDENSFRATRKILDVTADLKEEDTVLFLLSGGASALFEKPAVSGEELSGITEQLLKKGANIMEMNMIRKRLSFVKGGKFALHCSPAKIFCIVLSDVLGDSLDVIASGPACADLSTCEEALAVIKKYQMNVSAEAMRCLQTETPKEIHNVESVISGSVRMLCKAARAACVSLGYETILLTDQLCGEAKEVGSFMASIAKTHRKSQKNLAFIAGGETVVHVNGSGMGGRNQEIALAGAIGLDGIHNAALFSVGSDGTDGPTDAAGGYVDGNTASVLRQCGIDIREQLENNNAYEALSRCGGLIKTGATGTNVNDVTVLLIQNQLSLGKEEQ